MFDFEAPNGNHAYDVVAVVREPGDDGQAKIERRTFHVAARTRTQAASLVKRGGYPEIDSVNMVG